MLPKELFGRLKLTAAEKEVEGISIFRHFLSVREINVNLQLTKYCRLKTVVKAFFAWSSYCLRHFNQLFAIILLGVVHFFSFCPVLILSESINRQMF